ncbi:lipoprotein insertase outer membrane protein LolB [Biformimicrobium ophioploci]|uniref:Outer-membrane lipoprotein LolB n=1 Tax=Biformimicrobium ophioploci TaxID=3036711 RepID=A0ABQ6LWS5_9GAMM|nr:lipoprotein insertase outer membrane protein LolB [Microbulbifer sp. NKW57]GMG86550.1 lipoprotein insertase outer membrane protein LolB [Microbulbifer sp. NKW57]
MCRHRKFPINKAWVVILLAALLSACASQRSVFPGAGAGADASSPEQLHSWHISGKLGVRAPENSGSASLNWEQARDSYRIRLTGPLGMGGTVIDGDASGVTLKQSGQPTRRARHPQTLLYEALGWSMPVEELKYWVRGLPAPGSAPSNMTRNDSQQISAMQQAGWQLNFSNYQPRGSLWLPGKIRAERTVANQLVRVTLVIKDWRI